MCFLSATVSHVTKITNWCKYQFYTKVSQYCEIFHVTKDIVLILYNQYYCDLIQHFHFALTITSPDGGDVLIFTSSMLKTPPNNNISARPMATENKERDLDIFRGITLGFPTHVTVWVLFNEDRSSTNIWKCVSKLCFLILFWPHLAQRIDGTGTGPANRLLSNGLPCVPMQTLQTFWSLNVTSIGPIFVIGWHQRSGACHILFSTLISFHDHELQSISHTSSKS